MRRLFAWCSLLTCCLVSPANAIDASNPDAPLSLDPQVEHYELDNGLQVYLRQNSKPENRLELRLVINAGSVLEDDQQRGLAHFLEHMAFNGTKHFEKQELIEYLESIGMRFGADINAYTSFDETVYRLEVPTEDEGTVDKALLVLEDWSRNITLDPQEVDKERGVVIEEWRLRRGAQQRIRDQQIPVLYKGSRYAERLPIGLVDIIENAPVADLQRFYRDWYRPDLMAIIAVGDIDSDWLRQRIAAHFAAMPAAAAAPQRVEFDIPIYDEILASVVTDPEATAARVSVQVKLPLEHLETVGDMRQMLVESAFTGMLNSRYQEIVQKPNPPFIFASNYSGQMMRTGAQYGLAAGVDADGVVQGLRALLIESERVARHGFTAGELQRYKANSLRSAKQRYEERDNTESAQFAGQYVRHFLSGAPSIGAEANYELVQALLPGIELAEVEAVRDAYLAPTNRVLTASGPLGDDGDFPSEAALIAVFDELRDLEIEPYVDEVSDVALLAVQPQPGRIVREEQHADIEATEWTLSNGIRVFLKPTDHKQDEIVMNALSPGGHSLLDDATYARVALSSAFVGAGGVGEMSAIELGKFLAGKRVRVRANVGELLEGVTGECSPEDLLLFFELLHTTVTAPRRDDDAFGALKQRYASFIENRAASPENAYSDTLRTTLSQYHYRRRPFTVDVLNEFDYPSGLEFFANRFADMGDFCFAFVGKFDLQQMRPLVERYLASLPSAGRKEAWVDRKILAPEGVVEKTVYAGQEPKSQTSFVFHGDFEWNRQNRYLLGSLSRILQIRLREVLREDLGGTYGVGVRGVPSRDPQSRYQLRVQFGADPARVEELVGEMWKVLNDIRANGPEADDVAKVQEIQRRDFEENQESNRWWLNQILFRVRYDAPLVEIVDYLPLVEALTAADIQAAANRYIRDEKHVRVSLYPAAASGETSQ